MGRRFKVMSALVLLQTIKWMLRTKLMKPEEKKNKKIASFNRKKQLSAPNTLLSIMLR